MITKEEVEGEILRLTDLADSLEKDAKEDWQKRDVAKFRMKVARLKALKTHMFGSDEPTCVKPPEDGKVYSSYLPPSGGPVEAKPTKDGDK